MAKSIEKLKEELAQEKAMLKRFKDAGRDTLVKKIKNSISKLEEDIKKLEKPKKPKKSKKAAKPMGMTMEQCLKTLEETKEYSHAFVFLHHPRWLKMLYPGSNWNKAHCADVKSHTAADQNSARRYDGWFR